MDVKLDRKLSPDDVQEVLDRLNKLERELARQNIAFDAVFKLVEKLGTTLELDRIVRLFLLTVMGQLRTKSVVLFLSREGSKEFAPVHSLGLAAKNYIESISHDNGVVRWLNTLDKPTSLDNFFNSGNMVNEDDRSLVEKLLEGGLSFTAPLKCNDELSGVLFYSGRITGEPFTDFDDSLLMMLCKVAAITIKNASLYRTAIESKRELERFNKVKREFINHTSHELRTPLTVLKSALWSLEPEQMESGILVEMAKDAVSRLQTRVEYLLTLNEIELDNSTFRFDICDISAILEDCLREVIPELEEKQITVRLNDNVMGKTMRLDSKKMMVVIRSIVDNALNFVERGGNIDISVDIVDKPDWKEVGLEIGGWSLNEEFQKTHAVIDGESKTGSIECYLRELNNSVLSKYLVIRIKDDGIGIPPEEIAGLAEPFRRASNSTMTNVRGLGIGLSVSQKIVAGHGGRLFCKSEVGKGAEFSIWLPIVE